VTSFTGKTRQYFGKAVIGTRYVSYKNRAGIALTALFLCLGLSGPMLSKCEAKESNTGISLVSLDVKNEPLRGVLEKMSVSAGHEISVSEDWANVPLTIRFDSVKLEKALNQIVAALGKPSHVILTDKQKKKTEILIFADPPGRVEIAKDFRTEQFKKDAPSPDIEVVPSDEPGKRGLTQRELERMLSQRKPDDLRNVEVIPPEEPGGKGITQGELESLLRRDKTVDQGSVEVIPPEDSEEADKQ
jgi:hypothetical protein